MVVVSGRESFLFFVALVPTQSGGWGISETNKTAV